MSLSLRAILIGLSLVAGVSAQIGSLATTADGRTVYFSTDASIRPRGSQQPFSVKLFSLEDRSLTLIEDAGNWPTMAHIRPGVESLVLTRRVRDESSSMQAGESPRIVRLLGLEIDCSMFNREEFMDLHFHSLAFHDDRS